MREIRWKMAEKLQNADSGKETTEKNKQERKDNTTTERSSDVVLNYGNIVSLLDWRKIGVQHLIHLFETLFSFIYELNVNFGPVMWKWTSEMRRVTIHTFKRVAKRSDFKYIVTRLISDVHFHITGPKLTFKTYNYRHCDTSIPENCRLFSLWRSNRNVAR